MAKNEGRVIVTYVDSYNSVYVPSESTIATVQVSKARQSRFLVFPSVIFSILRREGSHYFIDCAEVIHPLAIHKYFSWQNTGHNLKDNKLPI